MKNTLPLLTALLFVLVSIAHGDEAPRSKSVLEKLDDRKAFFEADKVLHLDITVDEAGMRVLRGTPHPWFDRKVGQGKEPNNLPGKPYVKATVIEDSKRTYTDVGVRLRGGMGSWQRVDEKPGLFLNMDKYAKDQRFHGMEKLILHNSHQDPRFMNELLTGEIYRAAGVPAARIVHAVVTLNGRRLGLYYLKEGYDQGFVQAHFGITDGYMYLGDTGQDIDAALELAYGKESRFAPREHADLKALVAALNIPDLALRYDRTSALLDV